MKLIFPAHEMSIAISTFLWFSQNEHKSICYVASHTVGAQKIVSMIIVFHKWTILELYCFHRGLKSLNNILMILNYLVVGRVLSDIDWRVIKVTYTHLLNNACIWWRLYILKEQSKPSPDLRNREKTSRSHLHYDISNWTSVKQHI